VLVIIGGCINDQVLPDIVSYNHHIRPILSDKCFTCHGPDANKREANLRLDTETGAYNILKSGEGVGIHPGNPELSIIYNRISSKDPQVLMPPPESNLALTENEVKIIHKWIEQGGKYEKHWSFSPIEKPAVPLGNKRWAYNEIDHFIYQKAQEAGLSPNDEEERSLLLKRLLHDITGLPPTLKQQEDFAKAPDLNAAYEAAVDSALSSPHYGEKMAIFWMDLARYADSHGYQDDGLRTMWPWRDWVIHAFNENYNYKKFITWQLAGDLLPDANKETILATGFNRNHKITQEGGVIDEEYRIEYVTDRTNTFGKGLLGMTFECAKCHDHKYDPISQKDYYSTFAFFDQVPEKGLNGDISLASLADPPYMKITDEDVDTILSFINKLDTGVVRVMIMKDDSIPRSTHILGRGVYDQKGEVVMPNTPKAILPFDTSTFSQNRIGLAEWMFDPMNPLTARVFVNLVWQDMFGRGIVETAGDFGLQGALPSHPELLDWLAKDFMDNGWDIKRLVKQIVMSSTYRQSQKIKKQHLNKDPENIYLMRSPRNRLSAELLRDHVLASSGLLNKEIGGPSVKPYQPKGLWAAATSGRGELRKYNQDHGKDLYRRGLYTFIKRTVPPPAMLIYDGSNRDQCEVQRPNTSSPLQVLVMMNDPQILEASGYFAKQLLDVPKSPQQNIEKAFQTIVCRPVKSDELSLLVNYFDEVQKEMTEDKAQKLLAVGEIELEIKEPIETATLMQTIQLIYNLEESSMR
jgi:hypothetical protein